MTYFSLLSQLMGTGFESLGPMGSAGQKGSSRSGSKNFPVSVPLLHNPVLRFIKTFIVHTEPWDWH